MSKIQPKHRATIEQGKLKILDNDKFKMWIDSFNEGDKLEVVVQKERNNRTDAENRYYWSVVVNLLSEELGYTPEEMHELLKLKFNGKQLNVKGKEVWIGLSTARLNIKEFEDYLERIRIWAAGEMQIVVPLPNEVSIDL